MTVRPILILSLIMLAVPAWSQTLTNSRTQDGSGNLITSTVCGAKRCLDIGGPIISTIDSSLTTLHSDSIASQITLGQIKTGSDRIPASPSTDRTTAAAPFSVELSDGSAFYTGAKTGQLPAALDGSGYLKIHEQGTASVTFTNSTLAVTGAFYQATQPVSIASMPTTPVTGTFWQATQPVSGTFWQATQPVSGTVTANSGTLALTATGQQAVTASAVVLPTNTSKVVCITVLSSGTQLVYYGLSGVTTTTGVEVVQSGKVCRPATNSNVFYVIAPATGSTVSYEVWN